MLDQIDRYKIVGKLGEGGMAVVLRAHDPRMERDVAIKIIRPTKFPPENLKAILQRFEREARALAQMDHPNIVHVYDMGEFKGAPYLVMEFLPGGTLAKHMDKPVGPIQAAKILAPIARGLEFAHAEKIIHRDVKPANILFSNRAIPKLSDFGIAKIFGQDDGTQVTKIGMGIGTPAYMAPEQWEGQTGPGVDIYALGVVLFEMITGRQPYQADTPAKVLINAVTLPLPDPRQFVSNLPDEIVRILETALAKKPEQRFPSMGVFAQELEELARQPVIYTTPNQALPVKEKPFTNTTLDFIDFPTQEFTSSQLPLADSHVDHQIPVYRERIDSQPISIKPSSQHESFHSTNSTGQQLDPPKNFEAKFQSPISTPKSPGLPVWTILTVGAILITLIISAIILGLGGGGTDDPPQIVNVPTSTAGIQPEETPQTKDGMTQVFVSAGEFTMGSTAAEIETFQSDCPKCDFSNEGPAHTVYLDGFWIDRTEITNAMYKMCVADNQACKTPVSKGTIEYDSSDYDLYPIVRVSWSQANAYCAWAGRSLPTEAQWEKAARGTDGRIFPWGNNIGCLFANYTPEKSVGCYNSKGTAVGILPKGASPYGALDMAGNVSEWVADWFGPYSSAYEKNPVGPTETGKRVIRGGSFYDSSFKLRTTNRNSLEPNKTDFLIGFRCVSPATP